MIEEIERTPQAGGYRSLIVWIIYWYYRPISVHFSQRHVGNVPFSQLFFGFVFVPSSSPFVSTARVHDARFSYLLVTRVDCVQVPLIVCIAVRV